MKKKILLALSMLILVGCSNNENKTNRKELNKIVSNEISVVEKKEENKDKFIIKKDLLADSFEIAITKAKEISHKNLEDEKILEKEEINPKKSYIIVEYDINDKRIDPDFSQKPDYINLIKSKSSKGKIIKREEIGSKDKTNASIREIIEVEKIENKIDFNFQIEDEKLNMTVIL